MSLLYSVVGRKNPRDPESEFKYYPQSVSNGQSNFKKLARKIQKYTGQSYADVTGVLAALEDILPDELKSGLIVRFGTLGSFYATYKTTAGEAPEDVTERNIKEVRVRFRPNKDLLEQVNSGLEFKKVELQSNGRVEEEEEAPAED